jgi:uncharacterized membrane protein YkvA (DUF1232 family)
VAGVEVSVNMWEILLGVGLGLVLLWSALVVTLYLVGRRTQEPTRLRDALRLVPDVVRLLRRLAADPTLPRGVRIRLGALVAYLVLPIDLIPDFIPVVGYADDAIIVAIALRSATRAAGPEAIDRHWPGTPEGLAAVKRLAGLPA